MRTGASALGQKFPLTLGAEISGVVESEGGGTSAFSAGQEVFGSTNALFVDGYAEYAVVASRMIAKKPAAVSHVEAAALPVCAVTAWQMLFDHAKAVEGQVVAVYGTRRRQCRGIRCPVRPGCEGVEVVAIVRGDDAGYVRKLGASRVIDLRRHGLTDFARSVDLVIDAVGGSAQDQLIAITKPRRSYRGVGDRSAERAGGSPLRAGRSRREFFIVDVNSAQLGTIADMIEKKVIEAPIGAVLPLGEARAAHEMMGGDRPRPRGKLVLTTDG